MNYASKRPRILRILRRFRKYKAYGRTMATRFRPIFNETGNNSPENCDKMISLISWSSRSMNNVQKLVNILKFDF